MGNSAANRCGHQARRRIALSISLSVAFCFVSVPAWGQQSIVLSFDFTWFDRAHYTIHALIPPHAALERDYRDFSTELIKSAVGARRFPSAWNPDKLVPFVEDWIQKRHEGAGLLVGKGRSKLSALYEKHYSLQKNRSAVLFVTPQHNIEEILALSRFDHETEKFPQLDLEHLLLELEVIDAPFVRRSPRQLRRISESEIGLVPIHQSLFFALWDESPALRRGGAIGEILNYNQVDSELDFIPLLYLMAEALGVSQFSGRVNANGEVLAVDSYRCHYEGKARKRLYARQSFTEKLHFPNPDGKIDASGNSVMNGVGEISRAKFKSHLERFIKKRRQFFTAFSTQLQLRSEHRRSRACRTLLSEPIPGARINALSDEANATAFFEEELARGTRFRGRVPTIFSVGKDFRGPILLRDPDRR
jgi:hypothetical protein